MRFMCAERNVENLKTCTFKKYGTPVPRTKRRESQLRHFQEIWDSCAQKNTSEISKTALFAEQTSEISKNALSGIMGLLCAEQDVGNLKNVLPRSLGLLCAEQNVRNLKQCTFKNSGIPVRRTRRRKSQQMHLGEFWDSCAQNKTSEIAQQLHFQWDSCAQDKTSEI